MFAITCQARAKTVDGEQGLDDVIEYVKNDIRGMLAKIGQIDGDQLLLGIGQHLENRVNETSRNKGALKTDTYHAEQGRALENPKQPRRDQWRLERHDDTQCHLHDTT